MILAGFLCFFFAFYYFWYREKELGDVEQLKDPSVQHMLEKMKNFDATFTKEQVRQQNKDDVIAKLIILNQ